LSIYLIVVLSVNIITKQNTINMKILHQHTNPIETMFCTIGNNELITNITTYIKQLHPKIKIIDIETVDTNTITRSLTTNKRIKLDTINLFTDNTTIKYIDKKTFHLYQQYIDNIILINTDTISTTIKNIFENTRSILEPTDTLTITNTKT